MNIIVTNLYKSFDSQNKKNNVIDNISLNINSGELLSITGNSGSGKTTLLYLLSGLLTPDRGTVKYNNCDINIMKSKSKADFRKNNIGFVFQFYNLIPNLTIQENIQLPIRIDRKVSQEEQEYFTRLVEISDIKKILDKMPSQCSGGERQRAAVLRALITKPMIVYADEPTGSLDSEAGEKLMELFTKINKNLGSTICYVTHSKEYANMARRKIEIKDGKIVKNNS